MHRSKRPRGRNRRLVHEVHEAEWPLSSKPKYALAGTVDQVKAEFDALKRIGGAVEVHLANRPDPDAAGQSARRTAGIAALRRRGGAATPTRPRSCSARDAPRWSWKSPGRLARLVLGFS